MFIHRSEELSRTIQNLLPVSPGRSGPQHAVTFMVSHSAQDLIVLWSIWMSGNIAVPVERNSSKDLLVNIVKDSRSSLVIGSRGEDDHVKRFCLLKKKGKDSTRIYYFRSTVS